MSTWISFWEIIFLRILKRYINFGMIKTKNIQIINKTNPIFINSSIHYEVRSDDVDDVNGSSQVQQAPRAVQVMEL